MRLSDNTVHDAITVDVDGEPTNAENAVVAAVAHHGKNHAVKLLNNIFSIWDVLTNG